MWCSGREKNAGLGICSFQKKVPIFVFFSVLYKRTEQSLRSFPFFIKECSDLCVLFPFFLKEQNILFGLISHTNIANLAKKECKKNSSFFFWYIFIYICLYISIYISVYILKKERKVLAFFFILCKRMLYSLSSFLFLQKNVAFFSVLEKRTEKNGTFFWVS